MNFFLWSPMTLLMTVQKHQGDQNIICPGCKHKYPRASSYIEHLEKGHCEKNDPVRGITRREFIEAVQQKHVIKEIMKDPSKFEQYRVEEPPNLPSDLVSESEAETQEELEDGGVDIMDEEDDDQQQGQIPLKPSASTTHQNNEIYKLLQNQKEDEHSRARKETWPRLPSLPPRSISGVTECVRSMSISSPVPSISATNKSASQFASDITSRGGSNRGLTETEPSSPIPPPSDLDSSDAASEVTASPALLQKPATAWTTGSTSKMLFKEAKPTPAPENYLAHQEHEQKLQAKRDGRNMLHARFWDRHSTDYSLPQFFNAASLRYDCPFGGCNVDYAEVLDLEGHLINAHVKTDYRCKLCLKIFYAAHTFVAHAESSGKCKVKDTTYFDELLDDFTGGFLEAKRVRQPKIYKTSAVAKNADVPDGVMSIKFEATLPNDY